MPKGQKIIIPGSMGKMKKGHKKKKPHSKKSKKNKKPSPGKMPVPDLPITRRHGEFKDGLKPPTKDSFGPVPGTNPTKDATIFFHYVTPKDHLFRFTPEPLQLDYRLMYWTRRAGYRETPPDGLNEEGLWEPYTGNAEAGYVPPQSKISAFFEEIFLELDDRPIQHVPGAYQYEGFYGAAHKYFIPREALLKYFGNNEAFIPAANFRDVLDGISLDGRQELLKAADYNSCDQGKISMRFHFDATPFLCQGKNYLLASRQGETYSITNAWLPPQTKVKITLRKRQDLGSLIESQVEDEVYLDPSIPVANRLKAPLHTKLEISSIKLHFESAEISPGVEYRSLIPPEYYFDIPRVMIQTLTPNMNITTTGFELPPGTKMCYLWMMPSYQLNFNRQSNRRMSYRAYFPPGLASFGLKLNHVPIIFREPLSNFSTVGDGDCPGTRTLELYLKEKNWLSGTWPYIRPVGGQKYSYRNLIPVDLTQHKISGGELLTLDLRFANFSPRNWHVLCITVEESIVKKDSNFGWRMLTGLSKN
jgi:hypothetical protein